MSKNKILTIVAVLAALLIVVGVIVAIYSITAKEKTVEVIETTGTVYDGYGNELKNNITYNIPQSIIFTTREASGLPPAYVTLTVKHNLTLNNIKVDWKTEYADDGTDASAAVSVRKAGAMSTDAVVECKAPFSRQIQLIVCEHGNEENQVSCTIDYIKRFKGQDFIRLNGTDFDDSPGITFNAVLSEGTIAPDIMLESCRLYLDDDFKQSVADYLVFEINFTSYAFVNLSGSVSEISGNTVVSCEPEDSTYKWSWFITDFDNYDEGHKNAIYYAWYHAMLDRGENKGIFTLDFEITASYNGRYFGGVAESDYVTYPPCYLSGEQYGAELSPTLSLNKNMEF